MFSIFSEALGIFAISTHYMRTLCSDCTILWITDGKEKKQLSSLHFVSHVLVLTLPPLSFSFSEFGKQVSLSWLLYLFPLQNHDSSTDSFWLCNVCSNFSSSTSNDLISFSNVAFPTHSIFLTLINIGHYF